MAEKRHNFPKKVIEMVGKRAAFKCSRPDCQIQTIAPSNKDDTKILFIGIAAHICAASKGGARYDETMSPRDRKSASNAIFLCSNCASLIDKNDGVDFPVEVLKRWKADHENRVSEEFNKRQFEPTSRPKLSEDARELLLNASKDLEGVLYTPIAGGGYIYTNGRDFADPDDPRSMARWKAAMDELVHLDLLEPQKGEAFRLTHAGYELANQLGQSS